MPAFDYFVYKNLKPLIKFKKTFGIFGPGHVEYGVVNEVQELAFCLGAALGINDSPWALDCVESYYEFSPSGRRLFPYTHLEVVEKELNSLSSNRDWTWSNDDLKTFNIIPQGWARKNFKYDSDHPFGDPSKSIFEQDAEQFVIESFLLGCAVAIAKQSVAAKLLEDWSKKEKSPKKYGSTSLELPALHTVSEIRVWAIEVFESFLKTSPSYGGVISDQTLRKNLMQSKRNNPSRW